METGYFTRQEILSQPDAWAAALKVLDDRYTDIQKIKPNAEHAQIIFTGCGSTYYVALAAAALTQELTGLTSRALPASELWLYPGCSYTDDSDLLVAISRSGETTETLRACESYLETKRGKLLTISCYGNMPLAKMGTLNIVLSSGQEKSVAQTRAFTTLYLGTVALACIWAGREDLYESLTRLPEIGINFIKKNSSHATEVGQDASIDRFYWLGSGPRFGLASELSLKMKEMSLSHSEPFHFMEFRHGPKSMVTSSSLVIGLRSMVNAREENSILEDVRTLSGKTIDVAEAGSRIRFESGLDESIQNVLHLPFGQIIAFERALSKGLNPDKPTNLDTVVRLI